MNEIRERKNAIRKKYIALRRDMNPEKKKQSDVKICSRFLSLVTYRFADVLLLYAPLKDEIDIYPIAKDAMQKGKRIAFPLCNEKTHTMTYHFVTDLEQLRRGTYGIMEPTPDLELFDIKTSAVCNSVCFVPALVYDGDGYRLGYGKGYYDRYLGQFTGSRVGMVYDDFIVSRLPRGKFDLAVDFLITEKGVKTINAHQN